MHIHAGHTTAINFVMSGPSRRPCPWKWLTPPPIHDVDVDCWVRFGDLFQLWTVPEDMQLMDLSWLGSQNAVQLFFIWLLLKAPCARLAFAEAIARADAATGEAAAADTATLSPKMLCMVALQAAVKACEELPEASWIYKMY